ncbi:TIGR03943 family protein [Nonomuraea sp. NPDC050404]|uniref:TIGR03943 family putative permease subunit n=1 Tax=Nonomuraea sp. NPDC050404 TaxID=3155783 RepID=UPI0033D5BC31
MIFIFARAVGRQAPSALFVLLGAALLKISVFSADYANYVRPGFRPLLIGAGVVLVVLAVLVPIRERRHRADTERRTAAERARAAEDAHLARLLGREPAPPPQPQPADEGHDHGTAGRTGWLLMVPVLAIFLIAPPPLTSYAVRQTSPAEPHPPPPDVVEARETPLKKGRVNVLSMSEFANRTWHGPAKELVGKTIRLTGFVMASPGDDEWHLVRMRIGCCAADAMAMRVLVTGAPAPRTDTWVQVTGTWVPHPPRGSEAYTEPEVAASGVDPIRAPAEPYE